MECRLSERIFHFSLQLCYSTILDMKHALFIDTKSGFDILRYQELVSERLSVVNDQSPSLSTFLANLHVIDIRETTAFASLIKTHLEEILKQNSKISFIAIDSFSFLLKPINGRKMNNRLVHELLTVLLKLSNNYNVAIVLTNDHTTYFTKNGRFTIIPALGQTFGHRVTQRLLLCKDLTSNTFYANLEKSKFNASRTVEFQVRKLYFWKIFILKW